jgi:hypothetical protein
VARPPTHILTLEMPLEEAWRRFAQVSSDEMPRLFDRAAKPAPVAPPQETRKAKKGPAAKKRKAAPGKKKTRRNAPKRTAGKKPAKRVKR